MEHFDNFAFLAICSIMNQLQMVLMIVNALKIIKFTCYQLIIERFEKNAKLSYFPSRVSKIF